MPESGIVGKTVQRIEEGPTNPEYGYARDDTLLLHFTDGTALKLSGHSYEEVSLDHEEIDRDEVRRWQGAAQGRRETERLVRLQREEFRSLSDEERAERDRRRRAAMSPSALAMEDAMRNAFGEFVGSANRPNFGEGSTLKTITFPASFPEVDQFSGTPTLRQTEGA